MKKIILACTFVLAACSVTEGAAEWIANLNRLKNVTYVVDAKGTITMDGYTFILDSTISPTSALYVAYIGEFTNRETESIGFTRFEIDSAALSDSRVREPLIRYQLKATAAEALIAPKMGAADVVQVPEAVITERFMRMMRNLRHREFNTNGGAILAATVDITSPVPLATEAEKVYLQGMTTTDGTNIYFEEILVSDRNAAKVIPAAYYRNAHWRFEKAANQNQGVYKKVALIQTDPNLPTPPTPAFFYSPGSPPAGSGRPLREDPASMLPGQFIGVQMKADGLYFFYPSAAPNSFFPSAESVVFTGHSVKVSRPLEPTDVI